MAARDDEALETLKIAILPDQSDGDRAVQTAELRTYLTRALGIPVEIDIATDYDNAVARLVSGLSNIAYLGPLTYVQARDQDPSIEPLVAPINNKTGRPWSTSTIVSTIEIESLEDLGNKRFGFVNESSTSGFLVPNHEFKKMGLNPEADFAEVRYGGDHDDTLQLLLNGDVEAIAIDQDTYRTSLDSGKLDPSKYHLIWESQPITNAPVVISANMPPAIKIQLQKAFVNAPPGVVSISVAESAGYTIVQDADYEFVRELYRDLEPQN
jgi:phosphonate transport system substrate-binding protein